MSLSGVNARPPRATLPKLPAERPASADVYRWLMAGFQQSVCTSFDAHVVACVLTLAVEEAGQGIPLSGALGLAPSALASLVGELFPHALQLFSGLDPSLVVERSEEVGEHVPDRDRLGARAHPARRDHHRQALDKRAEHLERGAPRADHDRGAELDGRDPRFAQDTADLLA